MGGYMTKARLPIAIAILIAVFSIAPAFGQPTCANVVSVLPGEHVVLSATPNQPANYNYDWTGWDFMENGAAVPRVGGVINTPTLTFDAPTIAGDYGLNLLVTSNTAGSCSDIDCYTIHVVDPTCPVFGTYCITTTPLPIWSWLGIRHESYNYAWAVNGVPIVGATTYQYQPTAWVEPPFNVPTTNDEPIETSSVALTITQTLLPEGHNPITLLACPGTNAVTLVFKPEAGITSNVEDA
jgi:hypothetical protein